MSKARELLAEINQLSKTPDIVLSTVGSEFTRWLAYVAKRAKVKAVRKYKVSAAKCKEFNELLLQELKRAKGDFDFRARLYKGFIRDKEGDLKSHYYVLVRDRGAGKSYVVDIAADQYGYPEIVITDADDPRYE